MSSRRRKSKKRKNYDSNDGPPSKKQRTSSHPITIPYPPSKKHNNCNHNNRNHNRHNHNKQSSKHRSSTKSSASATNMTSQKRLRFKNKDKMPFPDENRIVQIGQTQKEFPISELMLFEFFRKRYSKLWTRYNKQLSKQKQSKSTRNTTDNDNDDDNHNHNEPNNDELSSSSRSKSPQSQSPKPNTKRVIQADFENPDDEENENNDNQDKQEQENEENEENEENNNNEDIDPLDDENDDDILDNDICSILVENFDVDDLQNLIFFVNNNYKIPISMNYKYLSSFMYVSDFFTQKIKSKQFEIYFEHYPQLIPYSMFNKWMKLNVLTMNNKNELKLAIKNHCNKYRTISSDEKRKIVQKITNCLHRIIQFGQNENYDKINLNDLCWNKKIKIIDDKPKKHKHSKYKRISSNNGKTITIQNNNNHNNHNNHNHHHHHQTRHRDRERDRDRDRDRDRYRQRDRYHDRDRDRDRNRDRERNRNHDDNRNNHRERGRYHSSNHNVRIELSPSPTSVSSSTPQSTQDTPISLNRSNDKEEMDTDKEDDTKQENKKEENNPNKIKILNHEQVRRLNERSLMVYWDGFKALNIKLKDDYNEFIQKYVLKEIKRVIQHYYQIADDFTEKQVIATSNKIKVTYSDRDRFYRKDKEKKRQNGHCIDDKTEKLEFLKVIPFSKLMYIITDIYAMIFEQKSRFCEWSNAMKPILDYVRKLSWIFFQFGLQIMSKQSDKYDIDQYNENNDNNVCFTKLYKRFLIHSLKNQTFKFKDILRKLVHKEPFIMYLYEEENFMENIFFKNISLSSIHQTELAKKLQTCNVYKHAQWETNGNDKNGNNKNKVFEMKYKHFIQETLGITNEYDRSLLMSVPL